MTSQQLDIFLYFCSAAQFFFPVTNECKIPGQSNRIKDNDNSRETEGVME